MKKKRQQEPVVTHMAQRDPDESPLDTFHKRLDEWIGSYCNGDITAFAEATNLSVSSIRGYLRRGNIPNLTGFLSICATGADPYYMLFGIRAAEPNDPHTRIVFSPEEAAMLLDKGNAVTSMISAATAYKSVESSITRVTYSPVWAKEQGFDGTLPVFVSPLVGNMEPTIGRTDIVAIDPDDRIPDDRIYLISYQGEVGFRRIVPKAPDEIRLVSDNPAFPPTTLTTEEVDRQVTVYGRARYVWAGRSL